MTAIYQWPLVDEFVDRIEELARLEGWWASDDREPQAIIGRRRVGKSWLFRRFAHGKPAVVLVAEQLPPGAQLSRFADELTPALGVRPDLPDVAALFRALYRAAGHERLLVAIDELPWLLGTSETEVRQNLSAIQAVMESDAAGSQLKLIMCGSHIGLMESLFAERNPMHGRLRRLELRPLAYRDARGLLDDLAPIEAFERYAVAGGMPRYLSALGSGSARSTVSSVVLDRNGPLFNEGRSILEQELREPRLHFAILEQLATGDKVLNEIAQHVGSDGAVVARYLKTLVDLRLVARKAPIGAPPGGRRGHWRLDDPFLRFWFRFVFPHQSDLESGLRPLDLYDTEVAPNLADHVSPVFEDWCQSWLRANRGAVATTIGPWWGNATNESRRRSERTSEEIDAVGIARGRVTLVAEAKWTNRPLAATILDELADHKVPALRDAGLKVNNDHETVLFSKGGYSPALRRAAEGDERITLVDVHTALGAE